MKNDLHKLIADAANGRGGMVISGEILSQLALRSLKTASAFGRNAGVEIPTGNRHVCGRFKSISIDPATIVAKLIANGAKLCLEINKTFDIEIELLIPNNGLAYSTIKLSVPNAQFPLSTSKTSIYFDTPIGFAEGSVSEAISRIDAIKASGISVDELLRIEGSMAYGTGFRLVNSALGALEPIDLNQMFPAFEFGGKLELINIEGSLLVLPQSFKFIGNTGCPKGDATAGMEIHTQSPQDNELTRTWPVLVTTPTPANVRKPLPNLGLVAAYLPKPLMDVQFGKVAPAITYREHDNGFIGYDVELSAAIRGVSVSIDSTELALRLRLDFASWGLVVATVDVPCVGRMDLAQARFEMPKNNGTGYIEAVVRLAVDTGGRLIMLTELESANLGEAMVSVQLFSKYLGMAGGAGAVYGFIADAVLGRIISNILPGMAFDAIKASVNQHFFVLTDLGDLLGLLDHRPNYPTWSDDGNSVLMGLLYSG
jgi:hypothetical protein